jgi:hypothetical protein
MPIDVSSYPDNSQDKAPAVAERREDDKRPQLHGKATRKKRSLGKRFGDTFLSEDRGDVGEYLIFDVLIPAAKDTLTDLVGRGLEMLLYGEARGSYKRSSGGRRTGHTDYSKYSRNESRRPQTTSRARKTLDFDDIVFDSRADAEKVLDYIIGRLEDYEVVTVADFYDAAEITGDYTDNKWGWYDLSDAYVKRGRDGFVIILPRPEQLT